jgi:hypothetical protein
VSKRAPTVSTHDDASLRARERARGKPNAAPGDAATPLLPLQHSAGNSAVGRLVGPRAISAPGDPAEREAEQLAAAVMRNDVAARGPPPSEEHAPPQMPSESERRAAPPSVQSVVRASGRPLAAQARATMESRFGRDFSHVHVHDDHEAAASAQDVGAHAYTVGPHIVFDAGRFSPDTQAGQSLLAHELTHVAQQAGDTPAATTGGGLPIVSRAPNPSVGKGANFTPAQLQVLAAARQRLQPKDNGIVGVLIAEDGRQFEWESGGGQGFSSHIEGKATAKMRELGITKATLLVELEPCPLCDRSTYPGGEQGPEIPLTSPKTGKEMSYQNPKISSALPRDSELKVIGPITTGTYRGTATPTTRPPGVPPAGGSGPAPVAPPVAPTSEKPGAPSAKPPAATAPTTNIPPSTPPLEGAPKVPVKPPPLEAEGAPGAPKPKAGKPPVAGTDVEIPAKVKGGALEGIGPTIKLAAATAAIDILTNIIKGWLAEDLIRQQTEAELTRLGPAFQKMLAGDPPPKQIHAIMHVSIWTSSHDVITEHGVEEKTGYPMVNVHAELADHGVKTTSSTKSEDIGMTSLTTASTTYSILLLDVERAMERRRIEEEEQRLNERVRTLADQAKAQPQAPQKKAPKAPEPPKAEPPNNALVPAPPKPAPSLLPGAPPPTFDEMGFASYARQFGQGLLAEGTKLRDSSAPKDRRDQFKLRVQVWRGQMRKLMRDFSNYKAKESLDWTLHEFDERMSTLGAELGIDDWKAE